MTNHEHTPPEESIPKNERAERAALVVETLGILVDLLLDKDGHPASPGMIHATWDQVRSPSDQVSEDERQFFYNQIHSLYTDSLERLYPALGSLKTAEDMLMELAMINDLPECDGWFALSQYRTEGGIQRAISFTLVDLGNVGVTTFASIMEVGEGVVKSYSLSLQIDGKIWGGLRIAAEDDIGADEDLLGAVHPSQTSSLMRVLNGNVPEYELDMKLAEIRIMSEAMLTEAELEELETYARQRYHEAVERRKSGLAAGIHTLTLPDLYKMRSMLIERMRQLELEQDGF